MGRVFVVSLEGTIYCCKHCKTHLAASEDIVSKSFRSRHGKAYLFDKVVNVSVGEKEEREIAPDKGEKYKEGRSVLELFKLSIPDENHYVSQEQAGASDADDV